VARRNASRGGVEAIVGTTTTAFENDDDGENDGDGDGDGDATRFGIILWVSCVI
jgi:hypothetical protein